MTEDNRDLLRRYLRETKAKSKTKSFGDLVARMRAEQEFRRVLDSLSNKIHSEEIYPFLTAGAQKDEFSPDFVVWKDEFRIPLFLVEMPEGNLYTIPRKKVEGFLRYLKRTDLTETILVWMFPPDFPSLPLRVEEMEIKAKGLDESIVFANVRPFKDAIMHQLRNKEISWPVPKLSTIPQAVESEDLLRTFESVFKEAFRKEARRRRPRLSYRKEALESVTDKDAEDIFTMIADYMKGESVLEDFGKAFRSIARTTRKPHEGGTER